MIVRRWRPIWIWGAALVGLATAARLVWVLVVPTVPVSDFAMYRESANYLSEFGRLDHGFIYMPGFVALLAAIKNLGGDLLAQKMAGVFFGALGAAGLFVLTWRLVDGEVDEAADEAVDVRGLRRWCPCPHAAVATAIYALWPAGVAMASVVGTDVPAAALIVTALALLVTFGPARPWTAALAFGAAMGLAAWVRAVALPLSALSLGYWLARRVRVGRALLLTGAGLAAALLVLSPWAIHHLRQSGALYFTDDHGGITALIGANPNSEGSYTRALNRLFKDVTGRSVLDEPHHATDQAAYAIVREWTRFEPRYTLGLVALKAERLFDPEIRLLYWPIFRPGVLVGGQAAWFAAHHDAIEALADGFGLAVMGLGLGGIALAIARRRFALLALLPFQLALAATYTLFFAEPRYRLPLEMLAFPFVALALGELGVAGAGAGTPISGSGHPFVAPARLRAGAGRALAPRLAGPGRRRSGAARAPPLGGDRGDVPDAAVEGRDAPAALEADAAVRRRFANRRGAGRTPPHDRRSRERPGGRPVGRGRRAARDLRRRVPGRRRGGTARAPLAGGRGLRRRTRPARRHRNAPRAPRWSARIRRRLGWSARGVDLACRGTYFGFRADDALKRGPRAIVRPAGRPSC